MATIKQAQERFLQGAFIVVAEFRGFKLEKMAWRDKKTGNRVSAPIVVYALEVGGQQVKVTEWMPDDTKVGPDGVATEFVPKHKKGDQVIWEIEALENDYGAYSGKGKIHSLEVSK